MSRCTSILTQSILFVALVSSCVNSKSHHSGSHPSRGVLPPSSPQHDTDGGHRTPQRHELTNRMQPQHRRRGDDPLRLPKSLHRHALEHNISNKMSSAAKSGIPMETENLIHVTPPPRFQKKPLNSTTRKPSATSKSSKAPSGATRLLDSHSRKSQKQLKQYHSKGQKRKLEARMRGLKHSSKAPKPPKIPSKPLKGLKQHRYPKKYNPKKHSWKKQQKKAMQERKLKERKEKRNKRIKAIHKTMAKKQ